MRALYFYIPDTLADWEPGHVLAELCSGRYLKDPALRYRVELCGRTMKKITTMGGIRLEPDTLLADLKPEEYDLLLLSGADTWLHPVQAPVLAKVRDVLESGITVAAICGATLGLADDGILDNRLHTSDDPWCPAATLSPLPGRLVICT